MQINTVRGGGIELTMFKVDVSLLLQTSYLLRAIARNASGTLEKEAVEAAAVTLEQLVLKYGAKYLDENGHLKESEQKKKQNDSAPEDKKAQQKT